MAKPVKISSLDMPPNPERRKQIRTMRKDMELLLAAHTGDAFPQPENRYPKKTRPKKGVQTSPFPLLQKIPKLAWIGLGALIVVLIALAAVYTFFFKKEAPPQNQEPSESQTPAPADISTLSIPTPHLPVDETRKLQIEKRDDLSEAIRLVKDESFPPDFFTRIVAHEGAAPEFIDLVAFMDSLDINIPPVLFFGLRKDFTFALYTDQKGVISQVLVVEFSPGWDKTKTVQDLSLWEKTMYQDLSQFITLNRNADPLGTTTPFQDGSYKQIPLRYLNLEEGRTSIDYALIPNKNLLILTTSRESIFAVIDLVHTPIQQDF